MKTIYRSENDIMDSFEVTRNDWLLDGFCQTSFPILVILVPAISYFLS